MNESKPSDKFLLCKDAPVKLNAKSSFETFEKKIIIFKKKSGKKIESMMKRDTRT